MATAPNLQPQAWLSGWARMLSPQPLPKEEPRYLAHPPPLQTSRPAATVRLIGAGGDLPLQQRPG